MCCTEHIFCIEIYSVNKWQECIQDLLLRITPANCTCHWGENETSTQDTHEQTAPSRLLSLVFDLDIEDQVILT